MHTSDVRISEELNKYVWHKGIRNVPFRVRVKLVRKRAEDEGAKDTMTVVVTRVDVAKVKGLLTETAELEDAE